MLLFNENGKQADAGQIKKELLHNLDNIPVPTEAELEQELGQYYMEALQFDLKSYKIDTQSLTGLSFSHAGGGILNKVRQFICKIITGASSVDEIIDAVLDVVSKIIPGGIILTTIVKKIVKYILHIGVDKFCNI